MLFSGEKTFYVLFAVPFFFFLSNFRGLPMIIKKESLETKIDIKSHLSSVHAFSSSSRFEYVPFLFSGRELVLYADGLSDRQMD